MWKKSKGTAKSVKRTITCDVETAQYEDGTVKCEKKVREPPNVTKKIIICDVGTTQCEDGQMWEKKVREPLNVRKELSHVILELHNVKMEPSNVRKT